MRESGMARECPAWCAQISALFSIRADTFLHRFVDVIAETEPCCLVYHHCTRPAASSCISLAAAQTLAAARIVRGTADGVLIQASWKLTSCYNIYVCCHPSAMRPWMPCRISSAFAWQHSGTVSYRAPLPHAGRAQRFDRPASNA